MIVLESLRQNLIKVLIKDESNKYSLLRIGLTQGNSTNTGERFDGVGFHSIKSISLLKKH